MRFISLAASALVFLTPSLLVAAPGDVAGSKDHPLLKRYEGSVIVRYDHKAYDEDTLPLGKSNGMKLADSIPVEGEVTQLAYSVPPGRSPLEVIRNYENDLKAAGYRCCSPGPRPKAWDMDSRRRPSMRHRRTWKTRSGSWR